MHGRALIVQAFERRTGFSPKFAALIRSYVGLLPVNAKHVYVVVQLVALVYVNRASRPVSGYSVCGH
jgi:hypothetical protein